MRELRPALISRNARLRRHHNHKDGIGIPPASLIFSATGTRDVGWFLSSGVATARTIREALLSIGRPLETFRDVFELGCGCGRVLRQWVDVKGPTFSASDYNPRGVAWAERNLGFVSFAENNLGPPLPFEAGAFDLCYAISVFTHLPESLQVPWLQDLHRVLRPRGILLVTLSGEGDLGRLTVEEQETFRAGEMVVVDPQFAGTNMCGVYHPEEFVRAQWAPYFKVLRFVQRGARGSPMQDLYVLERTDSFQHNRPPLD